jgi:Ca2+-transporting ATPase
MAGRGLRVLAVARAPSGQETRASLFGLVGLADPPRPEAIEAVSAARAAGITTVMITGDHPSTALAIATELGISSSDGSADTVVHARATPEDKLAIVRTWKARDAVVAMTGDGVNDAPALREAHIGIAMGRTGTEVTREASDIVLADDNFASIVAGIREGRAIFDNIRKTLVYLLAGNAAELAVMLVAAVAGWPPPLLPLQLLWINVVTDGFPALALAVEPPEDDVLRRPPRHPREPLLGRAQWQAIVATGLAQAVVALSVYVWALESRGPAEARSLAFSILVLGELFRALAARSPSRLLWEIGISTNLALLGVVVCSALVQLAIHYVLALQLPLEAAGRSPLDLVLIVGMALLPVSLVELAKLPPRFRHAS